MQGFVTDPQVRQMWAERCAVERSVAHCFQETLRPPRDLQAQVDPLEPLNQVRHAAL